MTPASSERRGQIARALAALFLARMSSALTVAEEPVDQNWTARCSIPLGG